MSQTLNSIYLIAAISEISKSDENLHDFVLRTAKQNAQMGYPFQDDPSRFTEALTAERMDIIHHSKGGQEFNKKVVETDVHADLLNSGLASFPLSRAEIYSLKITKVFFENAYPDKPDAFKKSLANARENLYGHLNSQLDENGRAREGRKIPPTILYSMTFSNGRGVGVREPGPEQLIEDMHNNPHIMASMERMMDAHDMYYDSNGLVQKGKDVLRSMAHDVSQKPLRALASLAAGVVVAGTLSLGSHSGQELHTGWGANAVSQSIAMDASLYPPRDQAYNATVTVHDGQTSSQIASDLLEAVGVVPTSHAISEMLKASNIVDPDRIIRGTFVDMKLPVNSLDNSQREALSKVADFISLGGDRIMLSQRDGATNKFLGEVERVRSNNSDLSM